ncbi:MAG: hypothetical protein J7513_15550 [Solirubrobacteraceae bacterium]|nr:hypothetical protein [Solirubrobacteraceae bacterium]
MKPRFRSFVGLALVCVFGAWAGDAVGATASARLTALERRVAALELSVAAMARDASGYDAWQACIAEVPVTEYGSPDGRTGYRYDPADGSAVRRTSALAIDRRSAPGRADYRFLALRRARGCASEPPSLQSARPAQWAPEWPAATPTVAVGRPASHPRLTVSQRLRRLELRVRRLRRDARRIKAAAGRFDAWSSCVSWLPVTQYGDPSGAFGYLFADALGVLTRRPALTIDRSDWDDPDYRFLAFRGTDAPGGDCADGGEETD